MVRRVNLLPSNWLLWTAFCVMFAGASLNAQSNSSLRLGPIARSPFLVAPSFALSSAPTSVAAGDLNGDGHIDLVLTKKNSGNVTVLLGDGQGGFSTGVDYPAAKLAGNVLVADLNGDGKLDVAVTDIAGTVDVLFGNGNGTLGAAVSYAAQATPAALAIGNFTGKGKIDLALAGAKGLSVLVNDGTGHFSAAGALPLAVQPQALVAADLRGTGHDDLVLANLDGTITAVLGDGTGNFHAQSSLSVAAGSLSAIVSGEFNGDGKPDLAIAVAGSNVIAVLLGHGDGSFAPAVSYSVGNSPAALVAVDLRSDGITDLVSANQAANTFSVLLGNGDGTFHESSEFVSGNTPIGLAAGDFNGDGKADLAIVNNVDANVTVPIGRGDGSFVASRVYRADLERKAIASGDLNGDGHSDLVVTNFCGTDPSCTSNGSATVFLGKSSGGYEAASTLTLGNGPIAVALADLNGDKKLDLLALNQIDKSLMVMLGNGDGTFGAPLLYSLSASPRALYVGDFNGDGRPDLAIASDCGQSACSQSGNLDIWLGHGDGSLADSASYTVGYAPVSIAAGDLRGTGHLDLVVANSCGDSSACTADGTGTLLANDGTGVFTQMGEIDLGLAPSSIALGNLSGSGLDLAVAQRGSNQIAVLHSNGNGTFGASTTYSVGSAPSALTIADLNGDGLQDVAVANFQSSTVSVLYGTGTGTLRPATTYPVSAGPDSLVAVAPFSGSVASLVTANGDAGSTPMGNGLTALGGTGGTTASTTTFTSAANTSTVDSKVTMAGNVAPTSSSGNPPTPTGNLVFAIDASGTGAGPFTYLADCGGAAGVALDGSGNATCNTQLLPAGTDNIQLQYFGDSVYATSASADQGQTVAQAGTSVAVTPASGSSALGQSVTLTATITPTSTITTTSNDALAFSGTVAFSYSNGGGPTSITGCNSVTATNNAASENATATCTTSALPLGSNTITATYSGDANYLTSTNSAATETVTQASTTTIVTASPGTNFALNTNVTYTATLNLPSGATATPSGTYAFTDNGNTISGCDAQPVSLVSSSYQASCQTAALTAGSHTIVATYSTGDTNYASSSGSISGTVIASSSTVAIVSSQPSGSTIDQSVTFTATVTRAGSSDTVPLSGTVSFTDTPSGGSATAIANCTALTLTSGQAACATSSLSKTSHTIIATYSGDSSYPASSPAQLTQSVNAGTATIALLSSQNPSNTNSSPTFTATVTPSNTGSTALTGTVNFTDSVTSLSIPNCGTVGLVSGVATCTPASLSVGTHTITATYGNDANFTFQSGGNTVSQVVNASGTSMSLGSSANPASVNQSITYTSTITVTGGSGGTIFSGTVAFTDTTTATTLCTGVHPSTSGVALCLATGLTAAASPHNITAAYTGDTNLGNANATLTPAQTVSKAATSLALTSSQSPSTVNTPVTFTATITFPSGNVPITGTVGFTDNSNPISGCTAVHPSASGVADCPDSALTASGSPHSIAASYTGDSNFNASSATLSPAQTVNKAATTLAVVSSQSSSAVNSSVTFTATITFPSGGISLTGSVAFTDSVTSAAIPGCSAQAVAAATGVATCSTSTLALGSHTITATYADSANNFQTSANTVTQTVVSALITMNLTAAATSGTVNQATPLAFDANITAPSGTTSLTGTVAFTDNGTPIAACSAVAPSANGTSGGNSLWLAVCSDSALTATSHTIAATYSGDKNFGNTNATLGTSVTITPATTTIAVTTAPNPSSFNQSVALSATVSAPAGGVALSGKVTLTDSVTSAAIPGCSALTPSANGVAACSYTGLAIGAHTVAATYGSDPNFAASSNSTTQTVGSAAASVSVTSSANPSVVNQSVTFTATVSSSAQGGASFAGNMSFSAGATPIAGCTALPVTSGMAQCVTALLPVGSTTITATYANDPSFAGASGAITQVVNQSTAYSLALSATPSTALIESGQSVTFTAKITPTYTGSIALNGNMVFTDTFTAPSGATSSVTLCSWPAGSANFTATGVATCTYTLPAGSNSVVASYTGDTKFTAVSTAASQNVDDFSVTIAPVSQNSLGVEITQGFKSTTDPYPAQPLTATPNSVAGYTGTLTLTCAPIPASASAPTCSLGTGSLAVVTNGTQASTGIALDATNAVPGTYTYVVTANDANGLTHTYNFPVTVRALSTPLSVVSGSTSNNTTTLTFVLPSGVSLPFVNTTSSNAGSCVSVVGPEISSSLSPLNLSIGCAFNPSTIPSSSSQQNATVTVTISTGGTLAMAQPAQPTNRSGLFVAGVFGLPVFGLLGLLRGRKSAREIFLRFIAIIALCAAGWQMMGCGGSFSGSNTTGGGQTPPGVYNILVQAVGSDNNTYQAVIQLNVKL